ncbi:MAG: leucine-rich repeat protein [Bacteroidales bacterium]|nr:leucine-rich repeat protein [Bacteroidales bacterium]
MNIDRDRFLMFTAQEDGSTIALDKQGNPPAHDFEFSLDGIIFVPYTVGSVITLDTDESVWFRKNGAQINTLNVTDNPNIYYKFVATGSLVGNGKLTALLGWWVNGYVGTWLNNNCFRYLLNTTSIVSPLCLPETIKRLNDFAFDYCSSLIGELDLRNVTIVGNGCFRDTKFDTVYVNNNLTSIGQTYNGLTTISNMFYYGTIQDFVTNYPTKYRCLVAKKYNAYILST